MTKIFIHGLLKEKHPPEYDFDVASPAEAMRVLLMFNKTIGQDLVDNQYIIVLGDKENGLNLVGEEYRVRTNRDIHLTPNVAGSGVDPITGPILYAFATIGAKIGVAVAGSSASYVTALAYAYTGAQIGITVGQALILAGISALLTPNLEAQGEEETTVFDNAIATVKQGGAVPLLYGEYYCDLLPVSSAITNSLTFKNW